MKKLLLVLSFLLLANCASQKTKSHMAVGIGAAGGYGTCRALLESGSAISAACAVVGAIYGTSLFYNDDMNVHKVVFVDALNTNPGKRSHTSWGSNSSGNWGSITVNRSYLVKGVKCSEYESVISIERSWPMYSISRENEFGVACQMPDGRWYIQ
jgi:surface antigen